jgi:hypothetical protein
MPQLPRVGLVTSLAGQRAAITAGMELLNQLRKLRGDYAASEAGHLEKALLQSGFIQGWQFIEGGLRTFDAPDDLRSMVGPFVEHIRERAAAPTLVRGISFPLGKQKGHPFLTKDDDALDPIVRAGRLMSRLEAVPAIMETLRRGLGVTGTLPNELFGVIGSRTGPIAKEQPYFEELGPNSLMTMRFMVKGTASRRRHIHMYPAVANVAVRTITTYIKQLIRSLPQFAVTAPDDMMREIDAWRARGFEIWGLDFSGLDKSVTTANYNCVVDVWSEFAPERERMGMYREFALNMSAIAPGWSEQEDLIQYHKDGGVASGFGGTTVDDCGVSAMAVAAGVAAGAGWSEAEVLRRHGVDWMAKHWGDDSLLALPKGFDGDAMVAKLARLGLTAKLDRAPVFLMVAYPRGGRPTNLVSRSYMQSVWREHNSRFKSVALFGLYVRLSLARAHPLFPALWTAVASAGAPDGLLAERAVDSFGALQAHVESATFMREIRADLESDVNEFNAFVEGASRGGDESAPGYRIIATMLGQSMLNRLTWKGDVARATPGTLDELKLSLDLYMSRVEEKAARKEAEGHDHPLIDLEEEKEEGDIHEQD